MRKTLKSLEEKYELELDKITQKIKKKKPKKVLLQLPEGIKPYATAIIDYLEEKTGHNDIRIHLGSCFGACDIPESDAELIIQFGHAPWSKKEFNEI